MRARLSSTWRPLASGTQPPTRPVLPPCGDDAACRARRRRAPPAPLRRCCRAAPPPAPCRASACASRAPRPTGRLRSARCGAADGGAQRVEQARRHADALPRPCAAARQRTCSAQARTAQAQHHLDAGEPGADSRARWSRAPRLRRRRARPAGSASGRCSRRMRASPASGSSERQHLQRQRAAAGGREPELPEPGRAAISAPTAPTSASARVHSDRGSPVRRGRSSSGIMMPAMTLGRRAVTAPRATVVARSLQRCRPGRGSTPLRTLRSASARTGSASPPAA